MSEEIRKEVDGVDWIRVCLIIAMLGMLVFGIVLSGCTMKYKEGFTLLRMDTKEKHASIERAEGIGSRLVTVSETGFPEWWLGKIAHTQVFLPKLKCTTYYDEETGEKKVKAVCEEIAPIGVESVLDAKGGHVGDQITSGTATEYGSIYQQEESVGLWIESIKAAVERTSLRGAEKNNLLKAIGSITLKANEE